MCSKGTLPHWRSWVFLQCANPVRIWVSWYISEKRASLNRARIGNGSFVRLRVALEADVSAPDVQTKTSLGCPAERQFRNTPQHQPLHQLQQRSCEHLSSHGLILQAGVIYCSSSSMAFAFTCSSVLGQVSNSSKKTLSHPRMSPAFKIFPLFSKAKRILWCLMQTHSSPRQWMRWRDGGTWEWGVYSVSIQALLLFLASGLGEFIDCDPTPNPSLFWSTALPSLSYSEKSRFYDVPSAFIPTRDSLCEKNPKD